MYEQVFRPSVAAKMTQTDAYIQTRTHLMPVTVERTVLSRPATNKRIIQH